MKFIIQTINGEIKHDFSFTLIESCQYHKWLNPNDYFTFMTCDYVPEKHYDFIPIGSVEFVCDFLKKHYNLMPKPKNIPFELIDEKWTGRNVFNGTEKNIVGEKFVKSNDKIKSFTEICKKAPVGNYQISDLIDIKSEWRTFVFKGKLVGLQNYSGEFDVFPNVQRITQMINEYKTQPISYTLDVAIDNNDNSIRKR